MLEAVSGVVNAIVFGVLAIKAIALCLLIPYEVGVTVLQRYKRRRSPSRSSNG
jgi:hypothetical protein